MDKYKKLKAIQGLILSADEQLYRLDGMKLEKDEHNPIQSRIITEYYDAIKDFLNKEDKNEKP